MRKLFEDLKELASSQYVFRIQDNGGATADRYTAVFCSGDALSMSYYPSHPQGFSMWIEDINVQLLAEEIEEGKAVDLAIGDLPEHIANHILSRVNEGWSYFLEAVEKHEPRSVSPNRAKAEVNDGTYDSGGKGIYLKDGSFYVKKDGDPSEDIGPYDNARDVMLATLPNDYSLSGPEYHCPFDVSRLEASSEVAAKIRELEERVDAAYNSNKP